MTLPDIINKTISTLLLIEIVFLTIMKLVLVNSICIQILANNSHYVIVIPVFCLFLNTKPVNYSQYSTAANS